MRKNLLGVAFALVACTAFAQDKGKQKGPPPGPPMTMTIPAFKDGSETPVKYSCSNAPSGVSPEIR